MGLWNKLRSGRHLFVACIVFAWVMAAAFILMQYQRERALRAELLNTQLQTVNLQLLRHYPHWQEVALPEQQDLRITLIRHDGTVVYDNAAPARKLANHLSRPEVSAALSNGTGVSIDRYSATNDTEYFYSATRGDSIIARTAMPYNVTLHSVLQADSQYFWLMGIVTLLFTLIALFWYRQAQIEEGEKIRIKKQLTNNINHELKTPVASIRACMETLVAHPDMDADKRSAFIRRCFAETERLSRLLTDVGTITRLDDGARQIARTAVWLDDVAAEAADALRPRAADAGMAIMVTTDGHYAVTGNGQLLRTVFDNLIDNAIAYSEGTAIHINLAKETSGELVITVADNGKGVPAEHLPHLFERFYRVDKGRSRSAGGTGLGLSIVKNAVLFHGGTISVANREGGGLCFTLRLTPERE